MRGPELGRHTSSQLQGGGQWSPSIVRGSGAGVAGWQPIAMPWIQKSAVSGLGAHDALLFVVPDVSPRGRGCCVVRVPSYLHYVLRHRFIDPVSFRCFSLQPFHAKIWESECAAGRLAPGLPVFLPISISVPPGGHVTYIKGESVRPSAPGPSYHLNSIYITKSHSI